MSRMTFSNYVPAGAPCGKLTEEQVIWARTCGLRPQDIQRTLGISKTTAWNILKGHTWKHVTPKKEVTTPDKRQIMKGAIVKFKATTEFTVKADDGRLVATLMTEMFSRAKEVAEELGIEFSEDHVKASVKRTR